jgi:hypothetical protein
MPYIHVDDDEAVDGVRKTTSLNCGNQRAYYASFRWYISMGNLGGMMVSTEEN